MLQLVDVDLDYDQRDLDQRGDRRVLGQHEALSTLKGSERALDVFRAAALRDPPAARLHAENSAQRSDTNWVAVKELNLSQYCYNEETLLI